MKKWNTVCISIFILINLLSVLFCQSLFDNLDQSQGQNNQNQNIVLPEALPNGTPAPVVQPKLAETVNLEASSSGGDGDAVSKVSFLFFSFLAWEFKCFNRKNER